LSVLKWARTYNPWDWNRDILSFWVQFPIFTMPPALKHLIYSELNSNRKEFRLLCIHPTSNPASLIVCETQTFELDTAPPFDALSYAWGNPNITTGIEFCGVLRQITTNLFAALIKLRDRRDLKWIWTDALCIDQNNATEKNYQVPLMRQIYRRAERVLSWLGEADDDTHLAFSLIGRWADAILATSPNLENWPNGEVMRLAVATIENSLDERGWAAIGTLFRKTYWERVWIVQEVSLARRCVIICGDNEILFDKIRWSFRAWISGDLRLSQLEQLLRSATHATQFFAFMKFSLEEEDAGAGVKIRREAGSEPSARQALSRLPFLVKRASALSATNPRDKIYGILGLLNCNDLQLHVDYRSSIEETFTRTIWSLIESSGRLDILGFSGTGSMNDTPSQLLPSWVPDFRTHHFDARFCEDTPFYDVMFFNAAGKTSAVCTSASPDLGQIRIRGRVCDEIIEVAEQSWNADERFRRWLTFILLHQSSCTSYRAPLQQIFFRTIIADHLWRGFETPGFLASHLEYEFCRLAARFIVAVRAVWEDRTVIFSDQRDLSLAQMKMDPEMKRMLTIWFRNPLGQEDDDKHLPQRAQIENFLGSPHSQLRISWPKNIDFDTEQDNQANLFSFRYVLGMTDSRCLFVTKSGYIGTGPGKVMKGDKIFIPLGCCVPITIRATANNFELIGDTYVCGMMQGEMMPDEMNKIDLEDVASSDLILCLVLYVAVKWFLKT
jgi:hypothetical protein